MHHHQSLLTLSPDSLVSGWVKLEQCHRHIDAVPSSQIIYNVDSIRGLRITRVENIERAWVQDHSVQMENIAHDAVLCIEAESRALLEDGPNAYLLKNGPFMRNFLDGYYPMRVTLTVKLGASKLRFDSITPAAQTGFDVHANAEEVGYDALFEGRLTSLIRFTPQP